MIGSVDKLTQLTTLFSKHSDDIEQVLRHPERAGELLQHLQPAQGTVGGMLSLPNFANPVQFICGSTLEDGPAASADNIKRAPRSARSGWGQCCAG